MNITFLIFGKCREKYINDGVDEYIKRISKYSKVSLVNLTEESLNENPSKEQIQTALKLEANKALKRIKEDDILLLCDIHAKEKSTEDFAKMIKEAKMKNGNFVFLIGSSYGLDDLLRKRANYSFSLSELTFTHYMALLILTEQVYRSLKINNGEKYDK